MKPSSMSSKSALAAVLVVMLLMGSAAYAAPPGNKESTACEKVGGIWNVLNPQHMCGDWTGSWPCGNCYHPNITDCITVNGTWYPTASKPPPFAHCVLPKGGGIQTTWPGNPGNPSPSGPGGVNCSRYGMVPNGLNGCRRPTVCDYDPNIRGCRGTIGSD
jgi:hypothetical protein